MLLHKQQSGFTLVELTAVIVIVGVLASVAVAKMAAPSFFERYAVAESASGLVQSAKLTAASSECNVTMTVANNALSLNYTTPCNDTSGQVYSNDGQPYKIEGGDIVIIASASSLMISPLGIVSPKDVTLDFDNGEKTRLTIDTMIIK